MGDRLSKAVDDVRFIRESFALFYSEAKRDVTRLWGIVAGTAGPTGETCGIKDCDRDAIGGYETQKRWEPDIDICRRHFLFIHITTRAIVLLVVAGLFALPIWLVVYGP